MGEDAMMETVFERKIEFITPTFLAGADQNRPEIRPASIRGALRWWFRVLGGTPAQERKLFGGIHGEVVASSIVVRVANIEERFGQPLDFSPMSDFGYLYYFAKVSGKDEGVGRTKKDHYFAPGTCFVMRVLARYPLAPEIRRLLERACEAFVRLGALGLRATRGCGAMAEADHPLSLEEFLDWTRRLDPQQVVCHRCPQAQELFGEWRKCQEALGGWLRQYRKAHVPEKNGKSALGFSNGKERESSALKLRPVKVKEGYLALLVYSDAACSQSSIRDRLP